MLFNSLSYGVFLPVVFIIYWIIPHKYRWIILLISSYYFYMSWNPKYVVLILGTTVVSYITALLLEKSNNLRIKKLVLSLSAIICLGILFVFKYWNFAISSICNLLSIFTIHIHPVTSKLLLPVGISFYTFQTLGYVIDVYKGNKAEKNFGYYAAFVSFFPQLVAGPIERTSNFLPQIKSKKSFQYNKGIDGLQLMLLGYYKKIVVADALAYYVDMVYANITSYTGFSLIIIIFFFTMQIYCDFSGYSDIAIGSAKLFGIDLMTNFKSPYLSANVKEFWSRWHISLSTWFRDYVYIPLGGNRVSKIRHKINILITFIASGLWHGANWTFVLWGAIHGIAQLMSGKGKSKSTPAACILKIIITFVFCNLAWVLFRAQTVKDALHIYTHLFTGMSSGIGYFRKGFTDICCSKMSFLKNASACCSILVFDFIALKQNPFKLLAKLPMIIRWIVYIGAVYIIVLFGKFGNSSFIYFAF